MNKFYNKQRGLSMPAMNRFLMMTVAAVVLSVTLSVGAVAQSYFDSIVTDGESSVPASKGAMAKVLVTTDLRTSPFSDPSHYSASPNYISDTQGDFEIWFSDTSNGTPGGGTAVKAKIFSYHFQSGNSEFLIEVPSSGYSGTNPYITVVNVYTSSSRQFRPGDSNAGGQLSTGRAFVKGAYNAPSYAVGSVYNYDGFKPIVADGSTYFSLPIAHSVSPYALNIWSHGTPTTPYVNMDDGGFNITINGGAVKVQTVAGYPAHSIWTFDLHPNLIPSSGNTKTVAVKFKNGLSGTWSPVKYILVSAP